MSFNWKSVVGAVAPTLATALGGPLAGVAVKTIATQLLGKPEASEDEVATAVAAADPQMLLKLREIDVDFKKATLEAGVKFEELAEGGRASARKRQVDLHDITPAVLAYLYLATFLVVLVMQFYIIIQKIETVEGALRILDGLTGILGTLVIGSKDYYFGSSASSRSKDETLSTIAKM